jgi:hypothetical protein
MLLFNASLPCLPSLVFQLLLLLQLFSGNFFG